MAHRLGKIYNVSALAIRCTRSGVANLREMVEGAKLDAHEIADLPSAVTALCEPLPSEGMQLRVKPAEARAAPLGGDVLTAISSSTSMDELGTALTLSALRQAAEAFTAGSGRDVLWSHFQGGDPMAGISDWRGVIGRTVSATIRTSAIARPPFMGAEGYVLEVDWSLHPGNAVGDELVQRIDAGQMISRSIGFNIDAIQPVYDEDDYLQVILIHSLSDVDHDSATRMPANPDALPMVIKSRGTRTKPAEVQTRAAEPEPVAVDIVPEQTATQVNDIDPGWVIQGVQTSLALQPLNMAWLWDANAQKDVLGLDMDWDRYRAAHALYNASAATSRDGYAFPVASMHGAELRLSLEAIALAMKLVNSEREIEGLNDTKRKALYETLSAYYRLFDRTAPEYKPPTERDDPEAPRVVSAPVEARSYTVGDLRADIAARMIAAVIG